MADQVIQQIHTAHQWDGTRVTFQTIYNHAGREVSKFKTFDIQTIGVEKGGLLQQCIADGPFPMQKSLVTSLLAVLKALTSQNEDVRRTFSTPPHALKPGSIVRLLSSIDSHFKSTKNKSRAASAQRMRQFILDCQKPLANGTLARQTPYVTCLPVPKRQARLDINSKNRNPSELPISPSAVIGTSSEEEVRNLIEDHYGKTIDQILRTCIDVLDEHERLQSTLSTALSTPLNQVIISNTIKKLEKTGHINYKVIKRRSPEAQLILALALVKRNSYHTTLPSKKWLILNEIACLNTLSMGKGPRYRLNALLSLHYLSRAAVTACFLILLCNTAWNPQTLLSLTAERIRRTAHGYEISGIKAKTNDFHNIVIHADSGNVALEDAASIRAIELLLWHDQNVSACANRMSNSIFVSLGLSFAQKSFEFNVYADSSHIREFTDSFGLPQFTPTDIRPYVERYRYLRSDMHLESSQTRLQHSDSTTTEIYVIGDIAKILNEANIIRYMSLLGRAIEYVTGRSKVNDQESAANNAVVERMLLPPTRMSANEDHYLVDIWLDDPDNTKLKIGEAEVEQCVLQRSYYLRNLQKMRQSNPERFRRSELPRILVCIALNNLIEQSPFRKLHETLTKAVNA